MKKSLSDILRMAHSTLMSDVHTAFPGEVHAVNEGNDGNIDSVDIKPLVKFRTKDQQYISMPIISRATVWYLGTADFVVRFPLAKGDGVLCICTEKSMEEWVASGGEVQASDSRSFSLTDVVVLPGLFSPAKPGKRGTGSGLEVIYKDGQILIDSDLKVKFKNAEAVFTDSGNIELNGNSKSFVTKDELKTAIDSVLSTITGHTHPVTSAPGTTGPAPSLIGLSVDLSAAGTTTIKTGG